MDLKIAGKHIDIGETFKQNAQKNIIEFTDKYKVNPIEISITLEKQAHHKFAVHIHGIISKGFELYSEAINDNAYTTLHDALEKFKQTFIKHKRVDHHAYKV